MLSDRKKQMNREGLGARLKEERTKSGFTQKALADALGLEYYVMISQMENGYMSIPPALWTPIADKLGIDRAEWVLQCLFEIQPEVYEAIFGKKSRKEVQEVLTNLHKVGYPTDSPIEPKPINQNPVRSESRPVTPSRYR